MSLGPVVSGSGLSENEVVRPENLSVRSGPDRVHSSRLEVDEDGSRDILVGAGRFTIINL